MAEVSIGGELVAEIDLVEAIVVAYLQDKVDIVGADTNVFVVSSVRPQCQNEQREQG